jgi:hypothetical protein
MGPLSGRSPQLSTLAFFKVAKAEGNQRDLAVREETAIAPGWPAAGLAARRLNLVLAIYSVASEGNGPLFPLECRDRRSRYRYRQLRSAVNNCLYRTFVSKSAREEGSPLLPVPIRLLSCVDRPRGAQYVRTVN